MPTLRNAVFLPTAFIKEGEKKHQVGKRMPNIVKKSASINVQKRA
jgi:hypothetical protein